MLKLLLIIGTLYVLALVYLTWIARDKDRSSANYLMAGSNVGSILGLFTFAATLFSTFTILGMPDFFGFMVLARGFLLLFQTCSWSLAS